MYNHIYFRRYNNSLVLCMWLLAELSRWRTCAISSFVPKGGILSPDFYHYAEIVSPCTSFKPTIRQQSGSAVCLLVPQCQTLPSVDGYVMMASSPFTGCGRNQHRMLSWNCWLACKCVRSCKLPKCTCMANGLACADMCKLQSCSSQKQQEDDIVELGDSDDDIDEQVDVCLWCLIIMFERSYTTPHTFVNSRPAVTRNCRKMTASNSVI